MILKCGCPHKYQDKKYGRGRRVHNLCNKQAGTTKYRCTVCETERER